MATAGDPWGEDRSTIDIGQCRCVIAVRSGSVEQGVIGLVRNQQNVHGSEHLLPASRSVQVANCRQLVAPHGSLNWSLGAMQVHQHLRRAVNVQLVTANLRNGPRRAA
jgi:hypothetical protein